MFTGPWQWSWDIAVKKSFQIKERHSLDIGADVINWMNHPTFYVSPATGGDYGSVTNFNVNSTTFGQITSMNYNPRVIQLDGVLPLLTTSELSGSSCRPFGAGFFCAIVAGDGPLADGASNAPKSSRAAFPIPPS